MPGEFKWDSAKVPYDTRTLAMMRGHDNRSTNGPPSIIQELDRISTLGMSSPSPHDHVRGYIKPTSVTSPPSPESPPLYDLSVHNLTYKVIAKVQNEVKEKILLNNISARANHSEVLAIAGPSGSSKTTFLDALAGQINRKSLKGQILVNGKPMDMAFKRMSGYVMQDDALYPILTARETFMFSARLRLPGSMKFEEKKERVNSLIEILGLTACADMYVGDDKLRGVSGGERRRVSIGVDLIHDPAVLFLDEPTSGLDSTSALHVMQVLSQMAITRQRTVLLTIHQPSYRLLTTINKFLVLARGNVVYHGEVSGMVAYFDCLGQSMPEHVNVVEYALDVIEACQDHPEGLQRLVDFYRKADAVEENEELPSFDEAAAEAPDMHKPAFATSFASETMVLMHRDLLSILRTKELFFIRIFLAVGVGLTMGTLFLHAGKNQKGVLQRQGFTSFTLAYIYFTSLDALPTFLNERLVFIRETSRGAHRASTYVISKALVSLPFLLFLAIVFTLTSYFLVGLVKDTGAILFYMVIIFMTYLVADGLVAFMASIIPDMTAGQPATSSLIAFYYLFSGIFIIRTAIPNYWIWLHYISIFKYPYEAIMQNEYGNQKNVIWYNNLDSKRVLSSLYSLGKVHLWICVVVMMSFAVGYRLLFYVALRFNTKSIRT